MAGAMPDQQDGLVWATEDAGSKACCKFLVVLRGIEDGHARVAGDWVFSAFKNELMKLFPGEEVQGLHDRLLVALPGNCLQNF